jgi:acetyl esterase/lipase
VQELGINPQKGFIIGGVSAGANLAAVVAHLYRDEKHSPPLTGQYLCIPTTCDPEALPPKYKDVYLSREQNKEGLVLNKNSIDMFESKPSFRQNSSSHPLISRNRILQTRYKIPTEIPLDLPLTQKFTSCIFPGLWCRPFKRRGLDL